MKSKNIRYGNRINKNKSNKKISFAKKSFYQTVVATLVFLMCIPVSKVDIPARKYVSNFLRETSDIVSSKKHLADAISGISEKYPYLSKNYLWNGFAELLKEEEKEETFVEPTVQPVELVVQAAPKEFVYPESVNMIMPVDASVTSPFGKRTHPVYDNDSEHYGVDLNANKGDVIISAAPGKVIEIKQHDIYGNCVLIQHTDRLKSFYAHMDSVYVIEGEIVSTNTAIGTVGETGVTTGPHLHFGIRLDDEAVNPEDYIKMNHQ